MSVQSRDTYWDQCRAVLMWLVILGHCIQLLFTDTFFSQPVFKFIYLFHMPLFMWISGYFALNSIQRHGWKIITNRSTQLLLPIFTIGTAQVFLLLIGGHFTFLEIISSYKCLWFLWSLFECYIFGLIVQLFKIKIWKIFSTFIPIYISAFTPEYLPYGNYLSYVWPFFVFGMYCRYLGFSSSYISLKWLLLFPLSVSAFVFFQPDWYMYLCPLRLNVHSLGIWIYRIIAALVVAPIFMTIIRVFPLSYTVKIGKSTLAIYVIQSIFCTLASRIGIFNNTPSLLLAGILSIVVFILAYYIYITSRFIPYVSLFFYGELKRKRPCPAK